MSIGVMLFNPFTGKPRHPSDIESDPKGILVWDGEEPLRAHKPAQRQWVGLTVEQMFEAIRPLYSSDKAAWLAVNHSKDEYRAIETKLKEKNNG